MFRTHFTKVMMAGGVLLLPLANAADETPAQAAAASAADGSAAPAQTLPEATATPATATEATTQSTSADVNQPDANQQDTNHQDTSQQNADQPDASQPAADQPELTADELSFNLERRQMTASGNAAIHHRSAVIQSDNVLLDQRHKLVIADGDVVITDRTLRFLTSDLNYGYEDGSFGAPEFRLGVHPLRVTGKSMGGTPEDLVVRKSAFYFNEPDAFSLNLHAGKMRLTDRKHLELEDVTFRIGAVPFFYLPGYSFGIAQSAPVEFSFRVGYNKSLGAFAQTQTLVRLWEELRLGANLDAYTARGVLAGPAGSYFGQWAEGSFIDTSFDTGYINDNGGSNKLGVDTLGRPVERNRFFADWRLIGGINNQIDLVGTLNWWSDSEVTRDFRDELFQHNPTPDNFFEATYRGENYLIGSFIRFRPNDWEQNVVRLPEVSFNLVPTEIFETGIYQRLDASYVHMNEKDPLGVFAEQRSNRLNAYYNLTRTFSAGDWFSFTPVAGAMVTHYADLNPGATQSNYTRVLGEVGFDAQMLVNGRWDLSDEIWGINGLRHMMRPILQYRYIPAAQAGDTLIPQLDRQNAFQTYLDPIGLADRRSIDNLYAQSTLRIGLENVLQTRSAGSYGSRQLVELNLYQQFNFIRQPAQPARFNNPAQPRQDTFSDFYTELTITPEDWLNTSVFTRIDPERFQLRQISTRTRVIDSDSWSAYVGNDYIEDVPGSMINQYVLGAAYRLNDRNQISIDWRIDGQLSEITEQYYGWQTMLGNSWLITTQIGYLNGSDRNNHFQFRIRADLKLF